MNSPLIAPERFAGTLDPSIRRANGYRLILDLKPLSLLPRIQDQAGASAALTALIHPFMEAGYTGNACLVGFSEEGLGLTSSNVADMGATLEPLVGSAATFSPFVVGNATRANATSAGLLTTGATTDADSGRGITFSGVFSLGSITSVDFVAGIQAFTVTPGIALNASTAVTSTLTDAAYFWFNPSQSANWQCCIDGTAYDSKVPVVASQDYQLDVVLSANRSPNFFINGRQISTAATPASLTAATAYVPMASLRTNANSAVTFYTKDLQVGRKW